MPKLFGLENRGINIATLAVPETVKASSFKRELLKLEPVFRSMVEVERGYDKPSFPETLWAYNLLFEDSVVTQDDGEKMKNWLEKNASSVTSYAHFWKAAYIKMLLPHSITQELLSQLFKRYPHVMNSASGKSDIPTFDQIRVAAATTLLFPDYLLRLTLNLDKWSTYIEEIVQRLMDEQRVKTAVEFSMCYRLIYPSAKPIFSTGLLSHVMQYADTILKDLPEVAKVQAIHLLAHYAIATAKKIEINDYGLYVAVDDVQITPQQEEILEIPPAQRSF